MKYSIAWQIPNGKTVTITVIEKEGNLKQEGSFDFIHISHPIHAINMVFDSDMVKKIVSGKISLILNGP